ncbi:hypothetical protein HXZ62_07040 [Empedobacter falsenii]|jgi:predicted  nucleic acid-binding Zn-ribbon protein|uniref:Chromosome segregation protein SMC n=1 Tax=Empedobacter falsenii TaxID=343874 RepID=A0AAW7DJ62_9FLAO|nr:MULTISPECIES: hypothetical protein [Empedobacter]MDH0673266.1 hypothetical protein [Empedobacter sp. GD03861]MDH1881931.1 hypothetical protein [Empedobacter sp. GD03797]MDM1040552.1 hypothetical protein [Empedobacter brevis]MDM1062318.1 hypothetical protein [Empedobacter falsenii]MDM1135322.1 hypothetical protein [Empedobacter sp. R750]
MQGLEENNQPTNKGKNGLVVPLALVGILLAGSVGYNIYQANQIGNLEKNESLNSQILKNETGQKDQIRKQYDSILNDYTQYKARIEDRNNLLGDKENMIQLKNQDIQEILDKDNPTAEEMNRARKMINDLEGSVKNYKSEVARLQKENAILVRSVDELNNKNSALTTDNNNLRENNKELTYNYETEKSVRQKDNAISKGKINELSSTLSVSNQQIKGIRVRNSGKEVEKTRAKRIDKIRVSFDVDRNSRTESGEKKLYVAIYNPDGTLGRYGNAQGGQIELRSGDTVNFSDAINFNYTNGQTKNITFDWENEEFQKGVYTFNVYENGFKISQAKITLN